jgi:hypothetical protein
MDAVTHPSPIAVWGVGLAFVAVTTVISACQPDDDSGTDGVVDDRCGEPGVCEGSYPTTVPEWERWELLSTGRVRLLDRSSGDNVRGRW